MEEVKQEPKKVKGVLTADELVGYKAKAKEIAERLGLSKVFPYIAIDEDTDERVVGYLKEPNYLQKLYAMDKMAKTGIFLAGEELRPELTIKEESDERTYSESSSCDKYRLGMATECVTMIEAAQNSFKKK